MIALSADDYARSMAAKNKQKNRPIPPLRDRTDIREVLSFHFLASRRRDVILDEANSLEVAGKIPEARQRLKQAEEIDALIKTLEDDCGSPRSLREE
jgi:hypothetical protein